MFPQRAQRDPSHEHQTNLINRPFDPNLPKVPRSPQIDQFFHALSQGNFQDPIISPQLTQVLQWLRGDPNAIAQENRSSLLLSLCKQRCNLFFNLDNYPILVDGLRRKYTSLVKTKANPLFCHLCASLIVLLFEDMQNLPVEILQLVVDDWCYDGLWFSCLPEVKAFCEGVLKFFFHPLAFPQHQGKSAHKFSADRHSIIEYFLIICIQEFGEWDKFKQLPVSERVSYLRFLCLGARYSKIRRLIFDRMPEWLENEHFLREVRDIFLNFTWFAQEKEDLAFLESIVACERLKEPSAVIAQGVGYILTRHSESFDRFFSLMVGRGSRGVWHSVYPFALAYCLGEWGAELMNKRIFAIFIANSSNEFYYRCLAEAYGVESVLLPLIENLCLGFDQLDIAFAQGLRLYSVLLGSLLREGKAAPQALFVGNAISVLISGYLKRNANRENYDLIYGGLFGENPLFGIVNSSPVREIIASFDLLLEQKIDLVIVLLENTVRMVVKYNLSVQCESFSVEFIHSMADYCCYSGKRVEFERILLCICALAAEHIGAFVWEKYPQMRSIISRAICCNTFESGDAEAGVPVNILLCRCRSPDFLMEFIKDSTTDEAFDSLSQIIESSEHVIQSIPNLTLVDFLIYLEDHRVYAGVREKIWKKMLLYLDDFVALIGGTWMQKDSTPSYKRLKGYRILMRLLKCEGLQGLFARLSLYSFFPGLVDWSLQWENDRQILSCIVALAKPSEDFLGLLGGERREEILIASSVHNPSQIPDSKENYFSFQEANLPVPKVNYTPEDQSSVKSSYFSAPQVIQKAYPCYYQFSNESYQSLLYTFVQNSELFYKFLRSSFDKPEEFVRSFDLIVYSLDLVPDLWSLFLEVAIVLAERIASNTSLMRRITLMAFLAR